MLTRQGLKLRMVGCDLKKRVVLGTLNIGWAVQALKSGADCVLPYSTSIDIFNTPFASLCHVLQAQEASQSFKDIHR